jgi:hypothetical protein
MTSSYNGWSADPDLPLRPLLVAGVSFVPGVRDDDDVYTVFRYAMTQYNARVERLKNPGCWGFAYRENRNDPNSLSNHSSGTAVDANAPAHPNGVPARNTFSLRQIGEIEKILDEVEHVLRWGGHYQSTPDAMHWEINADKQRVHEVARKIRAKERDVEYKDWSKESKEEFQRDVVDALLKADVFPTKDNIFLSVQQALKGEEPTRTPAKKAAAKKASPK